MSEWITDRLPTEEDAPAHRVWTMHQGCVEIWHYKAISSGEPWQPIPRPAPYVKPKRWTVKYDIAVERWKLYCDGDTLWVLPCLSGHGREAAQRIADIYNEEMP
jgi:hypothetical protein